MKDVEVPTVTPLAMVQSLVLVIHAIEKHVEIEPNASAKDLLKMLGTSKKLVELMNELFEESNE